MVQTSDEKLQLIDSAVLGSGKTLVQIQQLLRDEDEEVRLRAIEWLGEFGSLGNNAHIYLAMKDRDELVRIAALEIVGQHRMNEMESLTIESLKDQNASVRAAAAWALGKLGGEQTISSLIAFFDTDQEGIDQATAVHSLAELDATKRSEWVNRLLKMLAAEDYHVRCAVANLLGEGAIPEYTPFIVAELDAAFSVEGTEAARSSIQDAIKHLCSVKNQ